MGEEWWTGQKNQVLAGLHGGGLERGVQGLKLLAVRGQWPLKYGSGYQFSEVTGQLAPRITQELEIFLYFMQKLGIKTLTGY